MGNATSAEPKPRTPGLTREELYSRILALPPRERTAAVTWASDYFVRLEVGAEGTLEAKGLARDAKHRATFVGDPARYCREILRVEHLTPQQERWLVEIEQEDRLLVASAANLGKSFILGAYALYRFDAVAAILNRDGKEQGGRILLVGPTRDSVLGTIYEAIVKHAQRAAAAGLGLPGLPLKTHWWAGPEWSIEAFAPARRVDRTVAAGALGRHHVNQVGLIEEASDVEESVFNAIESSCSSEGNKVIAIFNPYRDAGAVYERRGRYKVLHASALDHPNMLTRSAAFPGAISHENIEERIVAECNDLGAFPKLQPNTRRNDFAYAIGHGPATLVKGAARAKLRVYRPGALFEAQVLGRWPTSGTGDLFDVAAWDEGVERWQDGTNPEEPPDRVGLDPAREGRNSSVAMGAWGADGEELLRAHAEARHVGGAAAAAAIARLQERRVRVSEAVVLPKGDGPTVGDALLEVFPDSPILLDEGGPGGAVLDHLAYIPGVDVMGVSFGEVAPDPVPGEPYAENLRTALYVRAALLVSYGLVDPPPDPLLRQEVLAHTLKRRSKTVTFIGKLGEIEKARKPSVLLIEKDEIKRKLGRSPDRAEAFVLVLAKQFKERQLGTVSFGLVRGSAGVFDG